MFNPLPIVIADYRRNRVLVIVTVLLVALAVAIGIAVIAQERALRQGSARAADDFDLLVGAPSSPTQLVLTSVYLQIRAIPLLDSQVLAKASTNPGIRYAAPIAFGDSFQGHPIVGTINAFSNREGQLPLLQGKMPAHRGEALIGAKLDLAIGSQFSPAHGLHHDDEDGEDSEHAALHYTVVGKLAPRNNAWDNAILVPVENVWAVHGLPDGHPVGSQQIGPPWTSERLPGIPAIAIKPQSIAAAYGLRNQFRTKDSMALFPAEVLNELYATLGDIRDMMSILTIATQILVITAVLMALLVGFLARRKQFAVLRAIGASRSYVFCVIWCEVSLLILSGALAGLGLGMGSSALLSKVMEAKLGFSMPISLGGQEILLVGALITAGLLIGILPAAISFRRSISEGLKD